MTRAVIFDVDGVLVDSYAAHFASWRGALRERGLDLSEDDFARTFGRTSREVIRELFGERVDDAQVREIDLRKEELYREIIGREFPTMDGATELIDALHAAGFRLALGSSAPPPNVELTLDRLGRRDAFAAVVTGRDVRRGKPDPQVFQIAAERLGIAPQRCAVIEDAVLGVEAARAAGMTAIALAGTASEERLRAAGAQIVVRSLRELSPEAIARAIDARSATGTASGDAPGDASGGRGAQRGGSS
ncbi:MAG TPA: HAD family phosphatase [Candidatus Binatia bacterium]